MPHLYPLIRASPQPQEENIKSPIYDQETCFSTGLNNLLKYTLNQVPNPNFF